MGPPRDALRATIAVRAFARPIERKPGSRYRPPRDKPPNLVLFIDTETRTDASQRLLFGSARLHGREGLLREWLFYPDDLAEQEAAILRTYVATHADDHGRAIRLLPVAEFTRLALGRLAYKERARVVGFNLPFDLSRLAIAWSEGGGEYTGGFSLRLFESVDAEGVAHRDMYRPDLRIKALGSKRQLIGFAAPARVDAERLDEGKHFRGRFLDLHQLAYALTDQSYTLDGATEAFGVSERKAHVSVHGVLSERYIDYNRQDVRTTAALYDRLIEEWSTHPIDLAPERAYSAATVGRAYLRAMGVNPPLEKAGAIDSKYLGYAMSAYFGGRAEVRIRRTAVPVRYVDFTSMYPTVFELCGLWSWITAASFRVVDATSEIQDFVEHVDRDALFDPATWRMFAGAFCLVEPAGELLPVRTDYGADPSPSVILAGTPTIGLNPLWSSEPLWYPLADVVVAKVIGGRAPRILEAFRIVPEGVQRGLRPVSLRGRVQVDPRTERLLRVAIEERNRIKQRTDLSAAERERTSQFLKTLANADSYGIFAQVDTKEPTAAGVDVAVDGLWSFTTHVPAVEAPGPYCFPPLAATITGAGRLLLALLQAEVESRGGSYLACDTDSLLIVAGSESGVIRCPGGSLLTPDGEPAIAVLSDDDVDAIVARFADLSPYDRDAVPSLLKIEAENVAADGSGQRVDLWGVGISAKRFVLYEQTAGGNVIRKASEHGLGLFRRPVADPKNWPKGGWAYWIEIVWQRIIDEVEGRPPSQAPGWFARPAVGQISTTTWGLLAPFRHGPDSPDRRVRPFNFMLVGHVESRVPLPPHVTASHVTPVAPYSTKPAGFLYLPWRNRVDGQTLAVTTKRGVEPDAVRLKTYGDLFRDYRWHPEHKSGDPGGGVGLRFSTGLLPRRPVVAIGIRHIGKETNRLDEVAEGLLNVDDEVHLQYVDERGEWKRVLPLLRAIGVKDLAKRTGMSERTLRSRLNSGRMPRMEDRRVLQRIATEAAGGSESDSMAPLYDLYLSVGQTSECRVHQSKIRRRDDGRRVGLRRRLRR